jgi:pyridoxamine 5'-phosphate oxidase
MARHKQLTEGSVEKNPYVQFEKWYKERSASGVVNPDAFTLATATRHGDVSARTVLLKDYNGEGFVFFTNYSSRKGTQLNENNRAAMLFYWPETGRQVRIEGRVQKVSSLESERYFTTRPRQSRISSWASEQSSPIKGKEELLARFEEYSRKFRGQNVPLPPHWGGFRLVPLFFEFWQEGRYRLHDRITYNPAPEGWRISRLAP